MFGKTHIHKKKCSSYNGDCRLKAKNVASSDFIFSFIQLPKEFLNSDYIFVYFYFNYFYRVSNFGLQQILSNDLKSCLEHAHIYGELISSGNSFFITEQNQVWRETIIHKIFERFSCEIAKYGGVLISVFQQVFAGINKFLFWGGGGVWVIRPPAPGPHKILNPLNWI